MFESSIVGVVKTLIFIIGLSVIIKFIGRLLIIKRNLNEEKDFIDKRKKEEKHKSFVDKNKGKISIQKNTSNNKKYEDVDFEDLT